MWFSRTNLASLVGPIVAIAVMLNSLMCLCATASAAVVDSPCERLVASTSHACCAGADPTDDARSDKTTPVRQTATRGTVTHDAAGNDEHPACPHDNDCHCRLPAVASAKVAVDGATTLVESPFISLPICLLPSLLTDVHPLSQWGQGDSPHHRPTTTLLRLGCALNC